MGEASPGYLARVNSPGSVGERIDETLPGVRLIAMVRQPVDRLYSAFARAVQTGYLPVGTDLVELVESGDRPGRDPGPGGRAAATPSTCTRTSSGSATGCWCCATTTSGRDPGAVYDAVLRHIGATPGLPAAALDRVLFAGRAQGLVAPLDDAQRRRLYRRFRADVEELEELLDWDLSAWDPGPAPFSAAASSPDTP